MATRQVFRSLWIGVLLIVFAAALAAAQDSESSSNPATAADGTGSSDGSVGLDGPVLPDGSVAPGKTIDLPTTAVSPGTASDPVSQIRQLGSLIPLGADPGGYRLGPLHATYISTSGFYDIATPTGEASREMWGTAVSTNLVYSHPVSNGMIAFQSNPNVSITNGATYFNTDAGVTFVKQLTARWSVNAGAQWTFFQNAYLLQNPAYLLSYAAGGTVQQNPFAQAQGSTMYETTNVSANYQMSGRTQLALSPTINVSFTDVDGTMYLVNQLGGGATLTHSFTPNRSVSVYGSMTRSMTSLEQTNGNSAWETFSVGGGFNQKIGKAWYFSGSLGTSRQTGFASGWTPTGSVTVMRIFRKSTLSAGYTRTTAAQVLLTRGYFDQADVTYIATFGRKISASVGGGVFRSVETGDTEKGKRGYASVSYRWTHSLAWSFGYNYSSQTGTLPNVYLGTTSYMSVGLNWILGRSPGR